MIKILISIWCILILTGCNKKQTSNTEVSNKKISYEQYSNIEHYSSPSYTEKISTFSTKIYDKNSNRMNNLKIGAKQLDNTIVANGSTFSFNDTVGPYTQKRGYLEAKIFDGNGNVLDEFGGGICQISTTLYNAVDRLGVEIIEKHEHSKSVQYIEEGKDATISYSSLDFKFKNNLNYDIQIKTYVDAENVTIEIYKNSTS